MLARRPDGAPGPEHFRRDDQPRGALADGQFLVRNQLLSIDPAQRGWLSAVAGWDPAPLAPRRERLVLTRRLRHQGFIIFDHVARFPDAIGELTALAQQGALVYREDIESGLDRAPAALAALLRGENRGKKLVRISAGEQVL